MVYGGAGPSSAFPMASSNYVTENLPFLDDKSFPIIFPDIVVGYHFTKADLITALSFRPINQKRKAYGFEQVLSRKSVNVEAYKFAFDYHGFAPYFGLGLSYENIHLTEIDLGTQITDMRLHKWAPNLVFGWDIRSSVNGDWWVLRTNLRYYPFLKVDHQGKSLSLQHLEFNFIQFTFYPQRLKKVKSIPIN